MENKQPQINLIKEFPVNKEELYKAWIDPSQLKQWWRPLEKHLTEITNEVKEGGKITYQFEENDLQINGEYKEVIKNDKLVYTWIWELPHDAVHKGEYLLTIVFEGEGNNSTLKITQENLEQEHSIEPHQHGWEKALDDLKLFLENKN